MVQKETQYVWYLPLFVLCFFSFKLSSDLLAYQRLCRVSSLLPSTIPLQFNWTAFSPYAHCSLVRHVLPFLLAETKGDE